MEREREALQLYIGYLLILPTRRATPPASTCSTPRQPKTGKSSPRITRPDKRRGERSGERGRQRRQAAGAGEANPLACAPARTQSLRLLAMHGGKSKPIVLEPGG